MMKGLNQVPVIKISDIGKERGLQAMCAIIKNGNIIDFQDILGLDSEDFFRFLQLRDYFIKESQTSETLNIVLKTMIWHIGRSSLCYTTT